MPTRRRFPPPCTAEETACYIVRDANGQAARRGGAGQDGGAPLAVVLNSPHGEPRSHRSASEERRHRLEHVASRQSGHPSRPHQCGPRRGGAQRGEPQSVRPSRGEPRPCGPQRSGPQRGRPRQRHLYRANLSGADLSGADLIELAQLIDTDFTGADLTGCRIFGVSAWNLKLEGTKQRNLVITHDAEPEITVDDIEVAQFIYLMLNNQKICNVIDTITSKAVLILGRFTDERKAVLDALREELRKRNYLPILFDFNVPATRDITETVSLLARMARFIIADLTDPSSIPKELEAIVPNLAVPVQPLLEGSSRPYAMFKDYWKYEWVLPVYRYEGLEPLLATLAEKVIAPAETKVNALAERRRMIEAELTKPQ